MQALWLFAANFVPPILHTQLPSGLVKQAAASQHPHSPNRYKYGTYPTTRRTFLLKAVTVSQLDKKLLEFYIT